VISSHNARAGQHCGVVVNIIPDLKLYQSHNSKTTAGKLAGSWTTTCSQQYLSAVHPLVTGLFDTLQFCGFRVQMTPKRKICKNPFRYVSRDTDSRRRQIWSNRPLEVDKISSSFCALKPSAMRPSPLFCLHSADWTQNFLNTAAP